MKRTPDAPIAVTAPAYEVLAPITDEAGEVTLQAGYTPNNGIRIALLDTESDDPNWREFDFTEQQAADLGRALLRWSGHSLAFAPAGHGPGSIEWARETAARFHEYSDPLDKSLREVAQLTREGRYDDQDTVATVRFTAAVLASAPAELLPDIGPDPMKGPRDDDRYEASRLRLRAAYVQQQKGVPGQTALVWRYDLGTVLEMAIRLKSILADGEEPVSAPTAGETARQKAWDAWSGENLTAGDGGFAAAPIWEACWKAFVADWPNGCDAAKHAALVTLNAALASAPAGDGVEDSEKLTPAQLDAVCEALAFVTAGDWDESSHGHRIEVYERAHEKLARMNGRIRVAALDRPRAAVDQCGKCRGSGHVQRGDSGECDACGGSGYRSPDTESPRAVLGERDDIAAAIEEMTRTDWDAWVAEATGSRMHSASVAATYRKADAILALQSLPAKEE